MALKNPLYMQMPFSVDKDGFAYISESRMENYSSKGGINFGDFFVCDATMRIVDYTFSENVQFSVMDYKTDAQLAELKEKYDSIIIRGSTYLWEGYDLGGAADFIEYMDKPVLLFGLGAQAPYFKNLKLEPGTVRFLKAVAERCHSIGTRGDYTAEQIHRYGVSNTTTLGCPTFMRKHDTQGISKRRSLEKVGVTLTRQAGGIYANNEEHIRHIHRELLRNAATIARKSYLISQGEKQEYAIANGEPTAASAVDEILSHLGFNPSDKAYKKVRNLYLKRTVAFSHMEEWEEFSRTLDFIIGFRLHGNIVALHQGVPAVFITCDSRIQEIVDFWRLPYVKSSQAMTVDIPALNEAVDFSHFRETHAIIRNRWIKFFNENGADHHLGPYESKLARKAISAPDQNLSHLCVPGGTTVLQEKLEVLLRDAQVRIDENTQLRVKLKRQREEFAKTLKDASHAEYESNT